MPLELEDDQMCYVCGKNNAVGLRLEFSHPKKGSLLSTVVFSKEHQGFKDIVHGGMMAMVLDEMMVNLLWKEGIPAVTVELNTRLKKTAGIGQIITLEGFLERQEGRAVYTKAWAKNEAGELLAEANATCLILKNNSLKNP